MQSLHNCNKYRLVRSHSKYMKILRKTSLFRCSFCLN